MCRLSIPAQPGAVDDGAEIHSQHQGDEYQEAFLSNRYLSGNHLLFDDILMLDIDPFGDESHMFADIGGQISGPLKAP
jgi:hypothetical protein